MSQPILWLPSDWHRVMFSDEPRFVFESDDHLIRVWRSRVKWSQSAFVLQRYTAIVAEKQETKEAQFNIVGIGYRLLLTAYHPRVTFQLDNAKSEYRSYISELALCPLHFSLTFKIFSPFINQLCLGHVGSPDSGTPKYSRTRATAGELLAEYISG
ncbi:hypothetical protein TNCV_904901 [Trichonephila clavipes]|nr:hypothetical protein TNCV_904901 [Trichonephila clavipes]